MGDRDAPAVGFGLLGFCFCATERKTGYWSGPGLFGGCVLVPCDGLECCTCLGLRLCFGPNSEEILLLEKSIDFTLKSHLLDTFHPNLQNRIIHILNFIIPDKSHSASGFARFGTVFGQF